MIQSKRQTKSLRSMRSRQRRESSVVSEILQKLSSAKLDDAQSSLEKHLQQRLDRESVMRIPCQKLCSGIDRRRVLNSVKAVFLNYARKHVPSGSTFDCIQASNVYMSKQQFFRFMNDYGLFPGVFEQREQLNDMFRKLNLYKNIESRLRLTLTQFEIFCCAVISQESTQHITNTSTRSHRFSQSSTVPVRTEHQEMHDIVVDEIEQYERDELLHHHQPIKYLDASLYGSSFVYNEDMEKYDVNNLMMLRTERCELNTCKEKLANACAETELIQSKLDEVQTQFVEANQRASDSSCEIVLLRKKLHELLESHRQYKFDMNERQNELLDEVAKARDVSLQAQEQSARQLSTKLEISQEQQQLLLQQQIRSLQNEIERMYDEKRIEQESVATSQRNHKEMISMLSEQRAKFESCLTEITRLHEQLRALKKQRSMTLREEMKRKTKRDEGEEQIDIARMKDQQDIVRRRVFETTLELDRTRRHCVDLQTRLEEAVKRYKISEQFNVSIRQKSIRYENSLRRELAQAKMERDVVCANGTQMSIETNNLFRRFIAKRTEYDLLQGKTSLLQRRLNDSAQTENHLRYQLDTMALEHIKERAQITSQHCIWNEDCVDQSSISHLELKNTLSLDENNIALSFDNKSRVDILRYLPIFIALVFLVLFMSMIQCIVTSAEELKAFS